MNYSITQTVRFYWRHAAAYPWLLAGCFLSVPVATLTLTFLPPLFVSSILQRLSTGAFQHGQLWSGFGGPLVWYAVLSLFGGMIAWRAADICIWKLEMRILRDIHREIFLHLLGMSANFHANRFGGSLVSQANKLADSYVTFADTTLFDLLPLMLSFVYASVILMPRVPWIACALLVLSAVFMWVAARMAGAILRLRATEADAENAQTGLLADVITNVLAVKSFAATALERTRFWAATHHTERTTHRVMVGTQKRTALFAFGDLSLGITALVLATAAAVLFHASIATTFLVITYSGLIAQKLWEFSEQILRNYNRAFGDAKEMIHILSLEPEVKDPVHPEKPRITNGAIAFTNVNFTHPDSRAEDVLFANLNLRIHAGERIGLVGHSGSGKTTLTKLLLRFNDIDGGAITIDGQNIAAITQDDLRGAIAYVPQEPLLFHRSIAENIAYGKADAGSAEIQAAAQKAYAHDFIEKLPKGYNTLVGERGVKLSGGQRQRVAIARAIFKDAPILVLDEATSALDSESEKLIQAALWELMQGRTAIVIAHRLSTIQKMDRIVVLDNGRIIEQGTHAELLKQNGTYAKLWTHQSGGFIDD